ncbi:MAG: nickel pincer cofactor biosynthesis protein LarC, partial [Nocardioidaceae bacterium]
HAVAPEHVAITPEDVTRNGFAAIRCHVEVADSTTHRTWKDIAGLLAAADLDEGVRHRAHATFERLAGAEAKVHGAAVDDVYFHEVGALDAIADVVGVCAGLEHLSLDELVVSPVAVGSGKVRGAHGSMPVPPPAVAELLRGVPSYAGPVAMEMCTPTGAALLTANATSYGPQPPMSVHEIGLGAGGRDPEGHANVLRLFVGDPESRQARPAGDARPAGADEAPHGTNAPVLMESNIDDLDPRLWPHVIESLLAAGASDAWLSPIVMKKGRPAHTLHVLVAGDRVERVRGEIFRHTSTIGLRVVPVGKFALDREMHTVSVDGHPVHVKLALHDGEVVNAQPEYDDLAAVANATGRPLKDVLAEAVAAARRITRN